MFIHLLQLGRVAYADGLAIQARVVAARKVGRIGDVLLLLEHEPVITLGRNASRKNVLVSDAWLAARGVELYEVNRGGDVTYHGPGQLVGYPIVDLRGEWPGKRGPFLGPVDFVRMLEEALILACGEFGVMAKRVKGCTGVWTFGGGDEVRGVRCEVRGVVECGLNGKAQPRGLGLSDFYLLFKYSRLTITHLHVWGKWMWLDWRGLAGFPEGGGLTRFMGVGRPSESQRGC